MNLSDTFGQTPPPEREIGTPELRKQIGKELRTAREVQQFSLEQVVSATKINIRNLRKIETGDWSFLPPPYVKAFILDYASVVGLQLEKIQNRIDEHFKIEDTVERSIAFGDQISVHSELGSSGQKSLASWADQNRSLLFYSLITIATVIIVIFYITRPPASHTFKSTTEYDIQVPDTADTSSTTQVDSTISAPVIQEVEEVIPAPPETFDLRITANDTCYIKVQRGDSLLYERTLWPGNRLTVEPDSVVKVSLGNAPGVTISVNGNDLPTFPEGRRVRVVRIDENGFRR